MAALAKDDPMDLGPFLEEYVLNNPFTSTSPKPTPPPQPKYCFPPNPRKPKVVTSSAAPVVSLPKNGSGSPVLAQNNHVTHPPVLAVKAIPIVPAGPVVQQVAPLVQHSQHSPPQNVGIKQEPTENKIELGGTDTPKAHIGSNKNFAAMLREMKLPLKHIKVKKWLFKYYRHVSNSPEWLSSEDLLEHAHTVFGNLKGNVMSRIMKVAFPHCHKVVNKYGYYYIGLLRRPQVEHCKDEALRTACKAVLDGDCSAEYAAQIHNTTAHLINRMVGWWDTVDQPQPELVYSDTGSEGDDDDSTLLSSTVRHGLQEKTRSRLRAKLKSRTDEDKTWSPQGRQKPYDVHGSRMHLRKRSNEAEKSRGEKEETGWSDDDDDDSEWTMEVDDMTGSGSDVNSSPLPVISAVGTIEVKVKDEPTDSGYEKYSEENNDKARENSLATEQFNTLRNILNTPVDEKPMSPINKEVAVKREILKTSPPVEGSGNNGLNSASGRSTSLSSVVDQLTMKQELQKTKNDFKEQSLQKMELERKLNAANLEIQNLQSRLASRENQIADLASEFFDLSNKFMKLSHKFKQALADPSFTQNR